MGEPRRRRFGVCLLAAGVVAGGAAYHVWRGNISPRARLEAARNLVLRGEMEGGMRALEAVVKRHPRYAPAGRWGSLAYTWQGYRDYQARRYAAALTALERAAQLDAGNDLAWYLQGFVFRDHPDLPRDQRGRDALAAFQKAEVLDPSNAEYHRLTAVLALEQRHYDLALREADRAAELGPGDGAAFNLLARVHADLKQMNRAIPEYKRAMQVDLEDLRPRLDLERLRKDLAYYAF